MPLTLVQLLAARGMAPVELQAAEARRVKLGGGLETSLLELGAIEESKIGDLWAEASRLPRPPPELLGEVTSSMATLFPQQLAERYGMVPLGLVRRQLSLLVRHPVDLSTVDEISFLLSRPLKLFVGTELEIAELLGTVYGVPVPQRLQDLRLKLRPAGSSGVAPVRIQTPPEATFAPPLEVLTQPAPVTMAEEDPVAPPAAAAAAPTAPVSPTAVSTAPAAELEPSPPARETPAVAPVAPPPSVPPAPSVRSMSPGEPWSIKFPLIEPPSASRRAKGASDSQPPVASPAPIFPLSPSSWDRFQMAASPAPAGLPEDPPEAVSPALATPELASPAEAQDTQEPLLASSSAAPEPPAEVPEVREPEPSEAVSTETPVPQASAPEPAREPSPEPAPEPAPVPIGSAPPVTAQPEPSPFEATPMSSGYGGRAGSDRRIGAGEALAAMRQEQSRDGVIGAAVDFLRGAFDFVAVFVRHQDTFQVFEATGIDYGGGADLTQTVVDLDRSKVLRTVVEGKAPYVGPIPAWDPLEGALGALGRGRLRAVLLYPVVIRDRTIAVVHGDRGGEALAPRQLSDVALVLSQLGAQLERVIRERRRQSAKTAEASSPPAPGPVEPPSSPPVQPAPPPLPVPPVAAPVATPTREAEAPVEPPRSPAFPQPPPPPPPSLPPLPTGEAFALAAPASAAEEALAAGGEEPFEVPIDWVEFAEDGRMVDQVRAFLSGDPPTRAQAAAALRAGREDAAWALAERFPGPLFVFRMTIDELPAPDAMGPVMGLMAELGSAALPALSDLAESTNEERRFWATMLIAKVGDHAAVPVLARRLLDASPDVALAARRGLWRLRKAPEFAEVLQHATSELGGEESERSIPIIRALGQFHHVPAIPQLITLLGARDPQVSQAANEALRDIARQDFGTSERRWNAWWEQSKAMPRLHWVIDALEDRDRDLRLAAISELTELTGFDLGYRSDLEPGKQAAALQRWREWLERDGRSRATPAPFPASLA